MRRLDEIKRDTDAATPGPWSACGHDRGGCICGMVWGANGSELVAKAEAEADVPAPAEIKRKANAAFIAAARTDVPDLVALVERLRDALKPFVRILDAAAQCKELGIPDRPAQIFQDDVDAARAALAAADGTDGARDTKEMP